MKHFSELVSYWATGVNNSVETNRSLICGGRGVRRAQRTVAHLLASARPTDLMIRQLAAATV
jgi:hypothetical protein